ncbi:hypothetical protein ACJROX_26080 [Pseudalkalibacillus sp. A8]|uniref:hypothetical protein n=1 Tax=Pseudalkalibacillus sp. A8 TaxID=3382641 RepID=UPI0038B4953E
MRNKRLIAIILVLTLLFIVSIWHLICTSLSHRAKEAVGDYKHQQICEYKAFWELFHQQMKDHIEKEEYVEEYTNRL